MQGPSDPRELLHESDLAGGADVIRVEGRHALLRFVRVEKGVARVSPAMPLVEKAAMGFAVVRLETERDRETFRPGLRLHVHLAKGGDVLAPLRDWDATVVLGRTPAGCEGLPAPPPPLGDWTRHEIADPAVPGAVAAILELPPGWSADGFVTYNPGDLVTPELVFARAESPGGAKTVEFFPDEHSYRRLPADACFLVETKADGEAEAAGFVEIAGMEFWTVGWGYIGDPMAALWKRVIPRYRSGVADLRFGHPKPMPWRAGLLSGRPDAKLRFNAASIWISYSVGDVPMREEFSAVAYWTDIASPPPGACGLLDIRSVRRPIHRGSETLEDVEIMRSLAPAPEWAERLAAMRADRVAGRHAELLALRRAVLAQDRANAAARRAYFDRWRTSIPRPDGDAVPDASFDRRMARVDLLSPAPRYEDPSGKSYGGMHEDRLFHAFMWTDGAGTFVGSDDISFDPNEGSGRTWTRAERTTRPYSP